MKSFLIIGIGKFGHYLCQNLAKYDCEIMIIDKNEDELKDLLPYVTSAKIGDCTNVEVLKSLGIASFDVCYVCIGENFQNSLEVTSLVKELGAKKVVSRATKDIHAKFLLRNGADEVIHPDRDIAERIAKTDINSAIYDYIDLDDDFSIYEIQTFKSCIGKSIREVNFRKEYEANIVAVKTENGIEFPTPEYIFTGREHLVIAGKKKQS